MGVKTVEGLKKSKGRGKMRSWTYKDVYRKEKQYCSDYRGYR